jgi:ABC-type transport system substrate-binding protein
MREYTVGSGAILDAFDQYALGRPKVDIVEIKFIVDPNTIAANILAGGVDVTFGGRLPLDWAQEIQERSGGSAKFGTSTANPMVVYQNLFNPNPAAILQPEFRRALVHALDRQQMMEVLVSGLTEVADATVLNPSRGDEFAALDPQTVKYAYDPRRAATIIEGLGYQKGTDGIYQDASGQKLVLELRTSQGDIQQERSLFSTADFWQQIGLGTDRVIVPSARRGDDEYRNTFPGFDIRRNPHRPDTLKSYFHSANAPFPERNYRGSAYIRYVNPEFDALIDLHDRTVPLGERREILGRLVHFITDQVLVIGLFYDVEVTVTTSRLVNVMTRGDQMGEAWNAHEWDVK